MVGLKDLHKLTSGGKYSLRFDFRDENSKCFVAVYDQIEVILCLYTVERRLIHIELYTPHISRGLRNDQRANPK